MTPSMDAYEYIDGNGRDFFDMTDPEEGNDDIGITIEEREARLRIITASVSQDLFDRLAEEAADADMTLSAYVAQTLEELMC